MAGRRNILLSSRFWGSFLTAFGVLFAYLIRDAVPDNLKLVAVLLMTAIVFLINYFGLLKPDERFDKIYAPTMDYLCGQLLGAAKNDWEAAHPDANHDFPMRVFIFKRKWLCLIPVYKWNVRSTDSDSHICFWFWRRGLVGRVENDGRAAFSVKDKSLLNQLELAKELDSKEMTFGVCRMSKRLSRITDHVVGIACIPLRHPESTKPVFLCIDAVDTSVIPTLWDVFNTITSKQSDAEAVLVQMATYNSV